MNIEFASKNDAKTVFTLLSMCKDSLIEQGIFQWDSEYPNFEYVEDDIAKGIVKFLVDVYDETGETVALATILTMVSKRDQSN